ncbi:Vam6/Vps39-like protein, partial [Cladochytrium tenue]
DVFSVQCLIDSLPLKIDTFAAAAHYAVGAATGSHLLVATADGSILLYGVTETPSFSIQLVESRKAFSRKPIALLELLPDLDTFLSLSDGTVSLHRLSDFAPLGQVPVKGVTLMALEPLADEGDGPASPAPVATTADGDATKPPVRRVVVASRRTLAFFDLTKDGGCSKAKELTIQDRPRALQWLSRELLAYAIARGYYSINLSTTKIAELLPLGGILNTLSDYATFSSGPKPIITQLPEGRLMLAKGEYGVFVNSDGSPLIERDLEWSATPEEVIFSSPYVVALMPHCIEVRSLNTGGVVQTIQLPDCHRMAIGSQLIHASSAHFVWRLLPFDFEDQVEQLISNNMFQDAQRLIEELQFSTDEDKLANIVRVRGLFAHYLFTVERKYEEAISILGELKASPVDVINLYPQFSLVGPSGDPPVTDPLALNTLVGYLTTQRNVLAKLRLLQAGSAPSSRNRSPARPSRAVGAVGAVAGASTSSTAVSSSPSMSARSLDGVVAGGGTAAAAAEDTQMLSEVVDTVLLKLYLAINPAMVGPLLRIANFCNVDECEAALIEKG